MIRPAAIEDIPAIVDLLSQANLLRPELDYGYWTHPTFVAVENDQVIGYVQFLLGQPLSYLTNIVVRNDYLGKGIGSQLVSAGEDTMRALGYKAWSALIMDETIAAQMLHTGGVMMVEGKCFLKRVI